MIEERGQRLEYRSQLDFFAAISFLYPRASLRVSGNDGCALKKSYLLSREGSNITPLIRVEQKALYEESHKLYTGRDNVHCPQKLHTICEIVLRREMSYTTRFSFTRESPSSA